MATIDRFEANIDGDADDRGVVLVTVALVEQLLEDAILARCLKIFESTADREKLFGGAEGGGGAINTFAAKIVVGHALGIYGKNLRDDLDQLRKIRNVFAHSKTNLRFKSAGIRNAARFKLFDPNFGGFNSKRTRTTRGKFLGAAGISMIFLYVTTGSAKRLRPRARRDYFFS